MTTSSAAMRAATFAPRRTSHRGRPLARAVLVDAQHADAVPRALAAMGAQSGARLFALGGDLLVVFADARRLGVDDVDGALLVDIAGTLSACPLTRDERARVADGAIVTVHAGAATVTPRAELLAFPAGALFDLSAFEEVPARALGVPPPPPAPPPPLAPINMRGALLGDLCPNAAREQAARDLAQGVLDRPLPNARPNVPPNAPLNTPRAPNDPARPPGADPAAQNPAAEQGPFARALDRDHDGAPVAGTGDAMMRWLARAGERLGLLERVRQRTREYVQETLQLLKDGRIDEGLLRAIPLTSPHDAPAPPGPPAMAVPGPRDALRIDPNAARTRAPAITVENDVYAALRRTYQEAAKRLASEKRFREAAFVHIELLGDIAQGVSILEQSNDPELLRLAAEVAEARGLSPPMVVRQWLLARDVRRAVAHARRHHAFGHATVMLESTGRKDLATLLRLEHAEVLERAGQYAEASTTLWPIRAEHRGVLQRVLHDGLVAHDRGRALLLARSALLDASEGKTPRVLREIAAAVHDDTHEGPDVRTTLARELNDDGARKTLGPLLAELARAILVDEVEGNVSAGSFRGAVEASRDRALRQDMPVVEAGRARATPRTAIALDGAAGSLPVLDARALPGARTLCALGEAGALLFGADGRVLASFSEPTYTFVVGDSGAVALGLARRGDVVRIARFDLVRKRATRWLDVRAMVTAPTFDGEWLMLARENGDVILLDAQSDTPKVGAQLSMGALVVGLARDRNCLCAALVHPDERVEIVRHGLPNLTQLNRATVPIAGLERVAALSPDGACVIDYGDEGLVFPARGIGEVGGGIVCADVDGASVALATDLNPAQIVVRRGERRLHVTCTDATPLALRLTGELLTVADDLGRVFTVDVINGVLLSTARVP